MALNITEGDERMAGGGGGGELFYGKTSGRTS